jgi:hypothetical protein
MLIEMVAWLQRRAARPWGLDGLSFYLRHCEDTALKAATLKKDRIVLQDDPSRLL